MTDYRRDIDGLRAIAVLSVLCYHLGYPWMPGGYVGVDVFFVISGYLITGIIVREVAATGKFSFPNFYLRRARRLFPALFATVSVTFAVGAYLLPPQHLKSLAGSVLAALFSVSNIFFWRQSGYFDTANGMKPLLHTWSLGVEEQFYLFWPFLVVAAFAALRGRVVFVLVAAALVSFIGSFLFLNRPSAVFYLLPFRVWEFAVGAVLLWVERRFPFKGIVAEFAYVLGGVLVVSSAMILTNASRFPYHNALYPCVGAAIMILAGKDARAALILTNPLAVGVGLISYSIYLVHWPLIVFYRYYNLKPLGAEDRPGIILGTLALALLLHILVEKPFRRPGPIAWVRNPAGFLTAVCGTVVLLSVPAIGAWTTNGWEWRYPPAVRGMMKDARAALGEEYALGACFKLQTARRSDVPERCHTPAPNDDRFKILLAGDSTANHLGPGLQRVLGDEFALFLWSTASCPALYGAPYAEGCQDSNNVLFDHLLKEYRYDLVIFSINSAWSDVKTYFPRNVEILDRLGVDYVLMGQPIAYHNSPIDLIARFGLGDLRQKMRDNLAISCVGEHGLNEVVPASRFFSMKRVLCTDGQPLYEVDGRLMQFDTLHLTQPGSVLVAEKLAEWLRDNGHLPSSASSSANSPKASSKADPKDQRLSQPE